MNVGVHRFLSQPSSHFHCHNLSLLVDTMLSWYPQFPLGISSWVDNSHDLFLLLPFIPLLLQILSDLIIHLYKILTAYCVSYAITYFVCKLLHIIWKVNFNQFVKYSKITRTEYWILFSKLWQEIIKFLDNKNQHIEERANKGMVISLYIKFLTSMRRQELPVISFPANPSQTLYNEGSIWHT